MKTFNEVLEVNEKAFLEFKNKVYKGLERQRVSNTEEREQVETSNIDSMSLQVFWKQYYKST